MRKCDKIFLSVLVLITTILFVSACTEQERAKTFGGTMTTEIAADQKLVNVTWKENELWILTRPRKPGEVPESYTFYEQSAWGMWEGTVLIKEK